MDPRASSEIQGPGRRAIGAALVVLAIASSLMTTTSPLVAAFASPLVFGAMDAASAALFHAAGPSARVRVVSRALAAAAWGGALAAIVEGRGAPPGSMRLPLLAIVLAVGTVLGSFGTGGERATEGRPPRGPLADAPLLGLVDVATTAWTLILAIVAHEQPMRTRLVASFGVALALLFRALFVARIVARGARDPESPSLAAVGFVGWIAAASIATAVAGSMLTWSGVGAALLLTVAAVVAESKRRRALVVFLRGSFAFLVATMLSVASLLSS